jgi:deoxyribonuclease V
MIPRNLHPWKVSYRKAVEIQQRLRKEIVLEAPGRSPRLVAGADVSYSRKSHRMFAAVVVFAVPDLELIEERHFVGEARFPYIPGLFTFREAPPLLEAFRLIECEPDLIIFDGQGIAHPRRFGLACHMGLLLDRPSIGCAKKRLVGEYREPGREKGEMSDLRDGEEVIGRVVRTRTGVKPVFVSPGHRVAADFAARWVLITTGRYRLPEPIRRAHALTNEIRREVDSGLQRPVRRHSYPDFIKGRG